MKLLQLHSEGSSQFLVEMKAIFNKKKNELVSNKDLPETKKEILLKQLKEDYLKQKKKSKFNLF